MVVFRCPPVSRDTHHANAIAHICYDEQLPIHPQRCILSEFPPVPLTLEGSSVLHQFFRFDWKAFRTLTDEAREAVAEEFATIFAGFEKAADGKPQSGIFSQLGHKGDLIFVHFRDSLEALNQIELTLAQTRLHDFLVPTHSYVSVVELGLYESTRKTYEAAAAKGLAQHSPEWNAEIAASLERGAAAMTPRLFPAIPDATYLCF